MQIWNTHMQGSHFGFPLAFAPLPHLQPVLCPPAQRCRQMAKAAARRGMAKAAARGSRTIGIPPNAMVHLSGLPKRSAVPNGFLGFGPLHSISEIMVAADIDVTQVVVTNPWEKQTGIYLSPLAIGAVVRACSGPSGAASSIACLERFGICISLGAATSKCMGNADTLCGQESSLRQPHREKLCGA